MDISTNPMAADLKDMTLLAKPRLLTPANAVL